MAERTKPAARIPEAEFMRDPSAVFKLAERDGSVVLTNEKGEPAMVISIPTDELPWIQ